MRPRVWVVLSDQGGAYAEVVAVLKEELTRDPRGVDWVAAPWQSFQAAVLPLPQAIVTVGVRAWGAMVEKQQAMPELAKVPIMATLVPKTGYEVLAAKATGPSSAVWLDQPLERYLALLRLAMPERQRLGVLFGPDSEAWKPALLKAAAAQGLSVHHATLHAQGDDLYAVLRTVLDEAQVLLALPDNQVFNPASLQNILIAAYRQRVPLVTYAPGHVKAGATLALYATPTQVAVQAAASLRNQLAGRGWLPARGTDKFTVAVNAQVGRSLGLAMLEPEALMDALRRQETSR